MNRLNDYDLLAPGKPPQAIHGSENQWELRFGQGIFAREAARSRQFCKSKRWLSFTVHLKLNNDGTWDSPRFEITYAGPTAGEIRFARDPRHRDTDKPEWHLSITPNGAPLVLERIPLPPFDPIRLVEEILSLEERTAS